jgi:hypothetical protein
MRFNAMNESIYLYLCVGMVVQRVPFQIDRVTVRKRRHPLNSSSSCLHAQGFDQQTDLHTYPREGVVF